MGSIHAVLHSSTGHARDAVLIKFLNPEYGLSPDQIQAIREAYAVDGSLLTQYLHTLVNFLKGDFGYSVQAGVPVSAQLAASLPPTLKLASLALQQQLFWRVDCSAFISGTLRMVAKPHPVGSVAAHLGAGLLARHHADPDLLIPAEAGVGYQPGPWESLVLPVATLAVPIAAPLAQILIRSIDEIRTRPFIAVAVAKVQRLKNSLAACGQQTPSCRR